MRKLKHKKMNTSAMFTEIVRWKSQDLGPRGLLQVPSARFHMLLTLSLVPFYAAFLSKNDLCFVNFFPLKISIRYLRC